MKIPVLHGWDFSFIVVWTRTLGENSWELFEFSLLGQHAQCLHFCAAAW
jgi:hypothetical protein